MQGPKCSCSVEIYCGIEVDRSLQSKQIDFLLARDCWFVVGIHCALTCREC